MTLEQLARTDPVTTTPDTPVGNVAKTLRDRGVGSVVVVEDDRPVGIVTDRDIAIRAFLGGNGKGLTAEDIMTEDPETVEIDVGIFELTERMREAGVRRMPLTRDGDLVGFVSMDDLNRLLVTELANLASVVADESPPF